MPLSIYDKATSRSIENTIITHQCLSGGIAFSALFVHLLLLSLFCYPMTLILSLDMNAKNTLTCTFL